MRACSCTPSAIVFGVPEIRHGVQLLCFTAAAAALSESCARAKLLIVAVTCACMLCALAARRQVDAIILCGSSHVKHDSERIKHTLCILTHTRVRVPEKVTQNETPTHTSYAHSHTHTHGQNQNWFGALLICVFELHLYNRLYVYSIICHSGDQMFSQLHILLRHVFDTTLHFLITIHDRLTCSCSIFILTNTKNGQNI